MIRNWSMDRSECSSGDDTLSVASKQKDNTEVKLFGESDTVKPCHVTMFGWLKSE